MSIRNGILLLTLLLARVHCCLAAEEAVATKYPPAVSAIRALGGAVHDAAFSEGAAWDVEFHLYGHDLTDEGLRQVAKLNDVVSLNLRGTAITGSGLVHLKSMAKLRKLHLERTKIDNEGVAHLAGLENLEYLNLYGTEIGDAGLRHLEGLTSLKRLYVWETKVTDAGVDRLAKKLPELEIVRGIDMSKLPAFKKPEEEKAIPQGELNWVAAKKAEDAPKSESGANTQVIFENKSGRRVKLYWVSYGNELMQYATLDVDEKYQQNTYARNSWLITDEDDKPLGYFIVTADAVARAVIPK